MVRRARRLSDLQMLVNAVLIPIAAVQMCRRARAACVRHIASATKHPGLTYLFCHPARIILTLSTCVQCSVHCSRQSLGLQLTVHFLRQCPGHLSTKSTMRVPILTHVLICTRRVVLAFVS